MRYISGKKNSILAPKRVFFGNRGHKTDRRAAEGVPWNGCSMFLISNDDYNYLGESSFISKYKIYEMSAACFETLQMVAAIAAREP